MRTGLARKNLIAFRAKGESLIHPLMWVVPTSPSADKDVRDPHAPDHPSAAAALGAQVYACAPAYQIWQRSARTMASPVLH